KKHNTFPTRRSSDLREGIVDYEKIRIIKQKAQSSKDSRVKQLVQELDKHMQSFNQEKTFETEKIKADVEKGKKLLEELSDNLNRDRKSTRLNSSHVS